MLDPRRHDPDATTDASVADAVEVLKVFDARCNEDVSSESKDAYSAEELALGEVGIVPDGSVRVLQRNQIPMTVVCDLVIGWRNLNKSGEWNIDAVHWCARRTGQGNWSWWIATLDPSEDEFRVWRVSKGGQGKQDTPTVTEQECARYRRKFELVSPTP